MIENQKKKVCRALTKSIFTFGNTSTQRGEGKNSQIKGNGHLKAWLASSDLVTLHDHVQDLFEEQNLASLKTLKVLWMMGSKWSG
jgi:hypothetical protein